MDHSVRALATSTISFDFPEIIFASLEISFAPKAALFASSAISLVFSEIH